MLNQTWQQTYSLFTTPCKLTEVNDFQNPGYGSVSDKTTNDAEDTSQQQVEIRMSSLEESERKNVGTDDYL